MIKLDIIGMQYKGFIWLAKVKDFAIMVTDKVQNLEGKSDKLTKHSTFIERQKILSATGLATCIRSHRDIFREDMCDELVSWLNDFSESELFKTNAAVKDLFCRAFVKSGRTDF